MKPSLLFFPDCQPAIAPETLPITITVTVAIAIVTISVGIAFRAKLGEFPAFMLRLTAVIAVPVYRPVQFTLFARNAFPAIAVRGACRDRQRTAQHQQEPHCYSDLLNMA